MNAALLFAAAILLGLCTCASASRPALVGGNRSNAGRLKAIKDLPTCGDSCGELGYCKRLVNTEVRATDVDANVDVDFTSDTFSRSSTSVYFDVDAYVNVQPEVDSDFIKMTFLAVFAWDSQKCAPALTFSKQAVLSHGEMRMDLGVDKNMPHMIGGDLSDDVAELPTCGTSCTEHGTCKGLRLGSVGAPAPVGIGISFSVHGMNSYGGTMTFQMVNNIDVGDVVRESYQVPIMLELVWTQQTCIPPPAIRSSHLLLAPGLKRTPWTHVKPAMGFAQILNQE